MEEQVKLVQEKLENEDQTKKPLPKERPFLVAFLLDVIVIGFLFWQRKNFNHVLFQNILLLMPFGVIGSFLYAAEKSARLPKNKEKHPNVFRNLVWIIGIMTMVTVTILFSKEPIKAKYLNSPPDTMYLETARIIITENQPLLQVVLDEMRLPSLEELESPTIPIYNMRRVQSAHPDAIKSKTMETLFSIGNFYSIERDGTIVTFNCGNYDNELHNYKTYFYFTPEDQPDLPQNTQCTLVESKDDQWVYQIYYVESHPVTVTEMQTIHRILPNWFYVSVERKYGNLLSEEGEK